MTLVSEIENVHEHAGTWVGGWVGGWVVWVGGWKR